MDCKHPEITVGAMVAVRIKENYYPEAPWDMKLTEKVAVKLTALKQAVTPYYPDMDVIGRLHKLTAYSREDMDDALGKEAELCQDDTTEPWQHSTVINVS